MIEFLLSDANVIYTSALAILFALALFEGVAQLIGVGLLSLIDDALPDVDVEADIDAGSLGTLAGLMSWLNLGRLPFLIWLTLLLSVFALAGLTLNAFLPLPSVIVLLASSVATLFGLRFFGRKLVQLLPKNETSAVSTMTFIGMPATVIRGTAKPNFPAEAEVIDSFQQKHFLMVAPEQGEITTGSQVVIVERAQAGHYLVKQFDVAAEINL